MYAPSGIIQQMPVMFSLTPYEDVKSGEVVIDPTGGSSRLQCVTPVKDNFLVPCLINKPF